MNPKIERVEVFGVAIPQGRELGVTLNDAGLAQYKSEVK
jgi:hypothetical protein